MLSPLEHTPLPIWLPVLACSALLWFVVKRHPGDRWHPGRIVIGLYLAMSIASLVFDERLVPTFELSVEWSAMVPYTVLLCMTLMPALVIRRPDPARLANHPLDRTMLVISAPFIVFAAVYLASSAAASFQRGFSSTRDALNVTGEAVLPGGPATTIAVATASYYLLFAVLLFVSLARRSGWLSSGVAGVGVGLALLHAMAFGARDGVLWAAQALAVGYWALGALLSRTSRRAVMAAGFCAAILGILYLDAATEDRFGGAPGGYWSGVLGYFGSQPYVFSETVNRLVDFYGPSLRFPVIAQVIGWEEVRRTQPFQWSFGTFLADFYGVAGWRSAVGLSLLLTGAVLGGLRLCWGRSALAYTIVVAGYTQFMVQGVFYYRLGNSAGNLFHLSLIGLVGALAAFAPDRGDHWPAPGDTEWFRRREPTAQSRPRTPRARQRISASRSSGLTGSTVVILPQSIHRNA